MAHATTVEIDHREKIELFRNTWLTLMQDFGQTMPLKVHIILDHLSDYFEMEGKTLRNTNDQFIEACHAKVRKFLTTIQTSITRIKALTSMEKNFWELSCILIVTILAVSNKILKKFAF